VENAEERIAKALEQTRVVRQPKQFLATFGVTNLKYFLVTEPIFAEFDTKQGPESVIREGKVIAKRPEVVTPGYLLNLQGFGDEARQYFQMMARQYGSNAPGLMYTYRNEAGGMNIVSGEPETVAQRIKGDLDGRSEHLAVVIRGPDELWDVALLKFIYEFTASSVASNVGELSGRGLLDPDSTGVPRAAIERIEAMFRQVEGGLDPSLLKWELDRWGLFRHYEDRFLGLFKKR
jgi:hypothetical protein